jgi:putative addiction module component (TIGR02574 family)
LKLEVFMNAQVSELIETAKSTLKPEERFALAEAMLESLEDKSDFEVDQAWQAEIGRRVDEVEAGTAKYVTADEAKARFLKLFK